jgi:hypothetical protein
MYVTTWQAKGQASRYTCYKSPGTQSCGRVTTVAAKLDDYVIGEIFDWLADVELRPIENAASPDTLRAEVEATASRLRSWDRDYAVLGTIDREAWQPVHDELTATIAAGRTALKAIERETTTTLQPDERPDLVRWWDAADIEQRGAALAALILSIRVAPRTSATGNVFDTSRVAIEYNWETFARRILSEGERDLRGAIVGGAKAKRLDNAPAASSVQIP